MGDPVQPMTGATTGPMREPLAGSRRISPLKAWPAVTLAIFLTPVAAGLAGTLLPAFGIFPPLGATRFTLEPIAELLASPGLLTSFLLSVVTGIFATILAVAIAIGVASGLDGTRAGGWVRTALAPLLAVPHAAFAVGFLFLVAPSGWMARLISPWATGWTAPPDLMTAQDPAGIALTLALAVKESLFLLLMIQTALLQVDPVSQLGAARALGYDRRTAWLAVVLPRIYPQIRLPLYAVLVFCCSNIDMAVILGPAAPPTLAVSVLQWSQDPDLAFRLRAAAGALLQVVAALCAALVWRLLEGVLAGLGRRFLVEGRRTRGRVAAIMAAGAGVVSMVVIVAALVVLALWSFTRRWPFPEALPASFGVDAWAQAAPLLTGPLLTSAGLAVAASLIAVGLVVGCLEAADRAGRGRQSSWTRLLYVPLLVPQLSFLFGVQILALWAGIEGRLLAVLWVQLVFVIPYVYLALVDPWRALDPRYAIAARCLGHAPAAVFRRVKLPLLAGSLATATAIGFAVSIALYLPTVFAGAGRVTTLTMEVVALVSGGDRRGLAAFALTQALLPLLALVAAALFSRSGMPAKGRVR